MGRSSFKKIIIALTLAAAFLIGPVSGNVNAAEISYTGNLCLASSTDAGESGNVEQQEAKVEAGGSADAESSNTIIEEAPASGEDIFGAVIPSVYATAHVQNIGWMKEISADKTFGTTGRSLRVEGIRLRLGSGIGGSIEYRSHVQNIGWEKTWSKDGQMSGTTGKSYRIEAVQIRLTGDAAEKYDVYYRGHVQNIGWLCWIMYLILILSIPILLWIR